MLQITGLETVESILHFQISAQRLVFITSVMSKASALLLCTVKTPDMQGFVFLLQWVIFKNWKN